MKNELTGVLAFLDQRLQGKKRGFELCNREVVANILRAFEETSTTVYVSGYAFPTELLWAFDVIPFDFEVACNNLPAALGGQGSTIMRIAENDGYGRDVCSFDRLILGCQRQGALPPGDLYLTSSYYCQGKAKTNELLAAENGKASVLFDAPHDSSPAAKRYVGRQLQEIAGMLAEATGRPLDLDRLKDVIRTSNRTRRSMLELNRLLTLKPCPWDGARACLMGLGGAVLWGSPILEQAYAALVAETQARAAQGTALPERRRILWFPWVPVQQTEIFTILRQNQVGVPMAEAAQVWWSELD